MKKLFGVLLLVGSQFTFGDAVEDLTKRVEALEKSIQGTSSWSCSGVCRLRERGYADLFFGPFHVTSATKPAAEVVQALIDHCEKLRIERNYATFVLVVADKLDASVTVKNSCVR